MQERNAWCKLDNSGDIWDAIKIIKLDILPGYFSNNVIYANQQLLGEYAAVNDYLLLRMFDFTRVSKDFLSWSGDRNRVEISNVNNVYGNITIVSNVGSTSRGVQVFDLSTSKENIANKIFGIEKKEDNEYETFIAQDWRHGKIREISCNPSCLASYYDESDLPYETTPAFFNPEVLLKYKTDHEKYSLDELSISCRGSWFIQSYDVNDAKQVSVYLCDLGNLPHKEQLHWKQYNEKPKTSISKKAFKRDFEGEFYDEYDSLQSLKQKLTELHNEQVEWWILRNEDLLEKVQYPYSESNDEWEDELMNLHQLILEGFSIKWLRKKAKELSRKPMPEQGSLKLLEECLIGFGFDVDRAYRIMTPFHELNDLRKNKAHVSGSEAIESSRKAIEKYGSYYGHFTNLCKELDESLELIVSAFGEK